MTNERKTHTFLTLTAAFLDAKEAEHVSPDTLAIYRRVLARFVTWAQANNVNAPGDVTAQHIRGYLRELHAAGLRPYTVHDYTRPVKTCFRFLYAEGLIETDPFARVAMPRLDKLQLPAFTTADARALLAACEDSRDPERDAALVLTLLDTGLRVSELCALTVGDVDAVTGTVTVKRGKGGKARTVYLGAHARRAVLRYLTERGDPDRGAPVFVSLASGLALTPDGVRNLLVRLGARAGVDHVHPHTFRRTFALWSLRAGMDLVRLAAIMGHSDLTVLRRYLALVEHDLRAAHSKHGAVDALLQAD